MRAKEVRTKSCSCRKKIAQFIIFKVVEANYCHVCNDMGTTLKKTRRCVNPKRRYLQSQCLRIIIVIILCKVISSVLLIHIIMPR